MNIISKIKGNMFLRNAVLAVCTLIIMLFVAQILLNIGTRHGQTRDVPDFSGLTVDEARAIAKKASLKIEVNDSLYLTSRTPGSILEQIPEPGAKVKSGRRVFLTVNSLRPKSAQIPYVAGFSLRKAKNILETEGFIIEKLIYRNDIATNNVLEQRYDNKTMTSDSKAEAPIGSAVTLIVGMDGNVTVRSPKVVGFPLNEARSRVWEAGLNIGKIVKDNDITELNIDNARVYRQSPIVSTRQTLGTAVDIFLTLDESKLAAGRNEADRDARNVAVADTSAVE